MVKESSPVRAFVSWAHGSPGWDHARTLGWAETVATFGSALRLHGIDADLDLFHLEDAAVDWTRYGPKAIADADVTLVVVSPGWRERWEGRNPPTVGAGAVQEADQLHGLFQRDQSEFQRTVKVVILPGATEADVPDDLRRLQRFRVESFDLAGLEELLRTLLSKRQYVAPPLGPVPDLPPRNLGSPAGAQPYGGGDGYERVLRDAIGRISDATTSPDALPAPQREQQRATWSGVLAAMRATPESSPAPAPPPLEHPADAPRWLPVVNARAPVRTALDTTAYSTPARLEVHLIARARTPVVAMGDLRAVAEGFRVQLNAPRLPRPLAGIGQHPVRDIQVDVAVEGEEVVGVATPPRAAFEGASPEALTELRLSRYGDVVAALTLARDGMGAVISDGSLVATVGRALDIALQWLPLDIAEVVPLVRLGPLTQVTPGDPAVLGTRNHATFPWVGRDVVTTAGADAVSGTDLRAAQSAVGAELVAQLVAALGRR